MQGVLKITRPYRYVLAILLVVFLAVSFLSLSHIGMLSLPNRQPTSCPFMTIWQSLAVCVPPGSGTAFLALLFSLIFIMLFWRESRIYKASQPSTGAFHTHHSARYFIPGPLQEAFSAGILNPKLF